MWHLLRVLPLLFTTTCFGPLGTFTSRSYAYSDGARLVEPAQLRPSLPDASPDPEKCLAVLFANHRLDSGGHFIVGLREDDQGEALGAWDDEGFEILTLELRRPVFGTRVPFNAVHDRLYYSAGGTAWARLCAGVFGTAGRGTVWLKRRWFGELAAEVDLLIDVRHARYPDSVEQRRVRRTVTLDRSTPSKLARALTGGA